MSNASKTSRLIHASVDTVYNAFTDPHVLEGWLAPTGMKGKIHHFNWHEGGGYEMSLHYSDDNKTNSGKTTAKEDRYEANIVKLIPYKLIILEIEFKTGDPDFAGTMTTEIILDPKDAGTNVSFTFKDLPRGISAEDNEQGTVSTLEKLAQYAEAESEIDEQLSDGSANAFDGK